jgi:hypothetical protein
MKPRKYAQILSVLLLLFSSGFGQSQYGLTCVPGNTCSAVDQKAEQRMADAKTVCSSADSQVTWRKDNKPPETEMRQHWININQAQHVAHRGYREVSSCTQADLVVQFVVNTMYDTVSIDVTDGDSGESVFSESRSIHDEGNDLTRLALHFHDATATAKVIQEQRERQALEAQIARDEQAKRDAEARRCDQEYNSLRNNIVSMAVTNHQELSASILSQIAEHNKKCSPIVPERIIEYAKAEEETRKAQAEAEAQRVKLEAQIAKLREQILLALQQRAGNTAFVPPSGSGWMEIKSSPPAGNYYIILPNEKTATNDCHPVATGKRTPHAPFALDCVRGRSPYFAVNVNNRMYVVKSDRTWPDGTYAGEVKDHGRTICLREAGCHEVLAEFRPGLSSLPDKPDVPPPGASTATYKGMGISFLYPNNWTASEQKKDDLITRVSVAPPEAQFPSWYTHGFFVGHAEKLSSSTTDQAFAALTAKFHQASGLTMDGDPKPITVGGQEGLMGVYQAPSPFPSGERGYMVVVRDKGNGYFWFLMFQPRTESAQPYQQTFMSVLQSVKFE